VDAAFSATFTDVTATSGISYNQFSGSSSNTFTDMTGGAAAGDVDGDGLIDLFVTRLNATDILYRNKGDGTFEDVSLAAGLTLNRPTNGAAFGDIDNDGDLDLYVTTTAHNRFYLYINNGSGVFTEQAVARGAQMTNNLGAYGQSAAFGDYDRDGYLDLVTGDWGTHAAFGS
jgi:hypothetical protein